MAAAAAGVARLDSVRRGSGRAHGAAAGDGRRPVAERAGKRVAAPYPHGAAGRAGRHGPAAGRRGHAHPALRHRHGVARHHVPLPGPRPARPPARAAARHADLHRRLLLRGAARLLGTRAAGAARAVRLAHGEGLLVPRRAHAHRCHPGAVGRALPLRVPVGARELRAAVDLRARGGAHAGADLGRRLLVGGAAAGATGARRRRRARPDGVPERPGCRAVPGRLDPHGQHLRDLAAALQPGGRGADRAGGAAVRAGAAGRREGRAREEPVPPHDGALSLHPLLRSGGLARLRGRARVLPAGDRRLRRAVRACSSCRPPRT